MTSNPISSNLETRPQKRTEGSCISEDSTDPILSISCSINAEARALSSERSRPRNLALSRSCPLR
eukprot:12910515-Prorocentrum_lima.AAC.1